MVDFKKLMENPPTEEELEANRQALLEAIKDDPAVKRMKRLYGDEP